MKTKKQEIQQRIMATIVVFFMGMMVFGSMDVRDTQAIGTNTTLIQNFVQGTLQLETSATLGFSDLTIGVGANSTANLSLVNVRDYRGTGAGWDVTGTMNNLTISNSAAGTNNISNAAINWMPGGFFALDGGSNTGVALGAGGVFSSAQRLINAAADYGMGNFKAVNTMINILYTGDATQKAGTYQNILTMTIV